MSKKKSLSKMLQVFADTQVTKKMIITMLVLLSGVAATSGVIKVGSRVRVTLGDFKNLVGKVEEKSKSSNWWNVKIDEGQKSANGLSALHKKFLKEVIPIHEKRLELIKKPVKKPAFKEHTSSLQAKKHAALNLEETGKNARAEKAAANLWNEQMLQNTLFTDLRFKESNKPFNYETPAFGKPEPHPLYTHKSYKQNNNDGKLYEAGQQGWWYSVDGKGQHTGTVWSDAKSVFYVKNTEGSYVVKGGSPPLPADIAAKLAAERAQSETTSRLAPQAGAKSKASTAQSHKAALGARLAARKNSMKKRAAVDNSRSAPKTAASKAPAPPAAATGHETTLKDLMIEWKSQKGVEKVNWRTLHAFAKKEGYNNPGNQVRDWSGDVLKRAKTFLKNLGRRRLASDTHPVFKRLLRKMQLA